MATRRWRVPRSRARQLEFLSMPLLPQLVGSVRSHGDLLRANVQWLCKTLHRKVLLPSVANSVGNCSTRCTSHANAGLSPVLDRAERCWREREPLQPHAHLHLPHRDLPPLLTPSLHPQNSSLAQGHEAMAQRLHPQSAQNARLEGLSSLKVTVRHFGSFPASQE